MIPLALRRIAEITGGELLDPAVGDLVVDGPVVTDSREAGPGSLYVARVGEHADGHVYIPSATSNGAVAALVTRPVEDIPAVLVADVQDAFAALAREVVRLGVESGMRVVGITGSSGKTSTKDLLAHVLEAHGETVATIGSLNSEVGVPLTLCRVTPTTRMLVVEMGARGIGHVDYLTSMAPPHVGVVLNVGTAHLGEFGSREAIATAKSELVQALPADGLAVLNADDELVRAMAQVTPARVCLTGRADDAQVRATDVALDVLGAPSFTLHVPDGDADSRTLPVALTLLGEHQVDNALAVVAVALELGMTPESVVDRLQSAAPASRWRMERHVREDGVVVVNDAYNANPDSMSAALRTLARMEAAGRRVAVLGAMYELGPESTDEHRRMGTLAADLGIDTVLAVGADAAAIADGAAHGAGDSGRPEVHHVDTLDAAEALLTGILVDGDVVLLKSSRDAGLRLLGDALLAQEVRS